MTGFFRRSRIAADAARSIRDASLGAYNTVVSGVLARLPRTRDLGGSDIRNILVIKVDRLGDVILASPFFRELRRNYPDATITAVTSTDSYPLMRSCPYVSRTVPLKPPGVFGARRLAHSLRDRFGLPDLTIVPRYGVDLYGAGWIAFFSAAPIRLAFSEAVSPRKAEVNRGANALFTDVLPSGSARHEVERNLDLLRYLGLTIHDDRLEIWPSESERREADSLLASASFGKVPLIAVGLGASQPKKMWPVERFAGLCRALRSTTGARFVVMGSRAERPLLNRFRELVGDSVAVSGTVSLGTVSALFEHCSLFVGTDSAQKHIAAAAGVPVVEVSCHPPDGEDDGSSNRVRFHAWGVAHVVLEPAAVAKPCRGTCEALAPHCILQVSERDAERAAAELLAKRPATNAPTAILSRQELM